MLHCQLPFSPHCFPWQIHPQLQCCPSWRTRLPGQSHHPRQSCYPWQVPSLGNLAVMVNLQSLANFPLPPQCCLVMSFFVGRLPFLKTLPPLAREAIALPYLRWHGPFCCAGTCLIMMLLAMHCNTLCCHSGCHAEHPLVTVPGVIIAMALSLSLPLAGTDVPTALPAWALGMHSHWAGSHHRTWHCCCPIWHCPHHLCWPAHMCQLPCCLGWSCWSGPCPT
jgi:hypothetical protein